MTSRTTKSAASAFVAAANVILEDEALKEMDVKYGGESPTPSQMAVHYSAGLAAATQGDLDGAQRHLSWLAGCLHDLEKKFSEWSDTPINMLADWEVDRLFEEPTDLLNTAKKAVKYIRAVAMEAGLHYWPGMLVPHQSLAAMLRAEQLRLQWLKCEPWTEKEKGGGWDAMGYYGWDASRVLSMFRRAGCKLGPRFDRLLRLHHEGLPTNCMKRSFSEEKQLAVARGARFAKYACHSNQALAVLGRMDPRVAVVAAVNYSRRSLLGLPYGAPARARHIDWEAVSRATEMWRQLDTRDAYSISDVMWYADHILQDVERNIFLIKALCTSTTEDVRRLVGGTLVEVHGAVVTEEKVELPTNWFPGDDVVRYVHLAYYAGKTYWATKRFGVFVITEALDEDLWYTSTHEHVEAVNRLPDLDRTCHVYVNCRS